MKLSTFFQNFSKTPQSPSKRCSQGIGLTFETLQLLPGVAIALAAYE